MSEARKILDLRLVNGEISEEEYQRLLEALGGNQSTPPNGDGFTTDPASSERRLDRRPVVGFGEAFSLYFKNYANFSGRSSRAAYWWATVWLMILMLVTATGSSWLFGPPGSAVTSLLFIATIIPSISLSVRRLHDIGNSGWWFLIALTGIGSILLLIWAVMPGTPGANSYGPNIEAGR